MYLYPNCPYIYSFEIEEGWEEFSVITILYYAA